MRLTVTWTLWGQSQIFRPLWQAVKKNILLLFSPGCAQGNVHDTIKLSTLKTSNCLLVNSLIHCRLRLQQFYFIKPRVSHERVQL